MTFTELSLEELNDPLALLMKSLFTSSDLSQAAGRAYVERLQLRAMLGRFRQPAAGRSKSRHPLGPDRFNQHCLATTAGMPCLRCLAHRTNGEN